MPSEFLLQVILNWNLMPQSSCEPFATGMNENNGLD